MEEKKSGFNREEEISALFDQLDITQEERDLLRAFETYASSRAMFGKLVTKTLETVPLDDFCGELKISRQTAQLWADGINAPHPLGRPPAICAMAIDFGVKPPTC